MATTTEERQRRLPDGDGDPGSGVAAKLAPAIEKLDRRSPEGRGFAISFWDGSVLPATGDDESEHPTLHLTNPDGLARIIRAPGELGFSRAWVSGDLEVKGDLERALTETESWRHAGLKPGDLIDTAKAIRATGVLRRGAPPAPQSEARLRGRLHSDKRDRAAIAHHYDVSNAFYRRMLGPTMVYSCAYFESDADSLDSAQTRKLDLICRKLDLQPGERMLDIGCGWGSLLIHAAGHYGVRAVGVTISEAQAQLARERISQAGLSDLCEVRVEDYRAVADGPYDKIASIGMFEHVGRRNLWLYLERITELLSPEGLFLNHGIVRTQPVRTNPRSFSRRFVFPDGELQTQGFVIDTIEQVGLELIDDESLRPHYAKTLRCWAANHDANRTAAIEEIGVERERVWRLHNVGAALAFDRGAISVHQALTRKLAGERRLPVRLRTGPRTVAARSA
ncbi:MAG: class I SAM-dependent methyltransferase [Actinomycetes bacterium]